ncbi:hypothetical protein [Kitasatospora sp. RG8]|nr:hypothetical protein [Kitasatospora sp. RG8]
MDAPAHRLDGAERRTTPADVTFSASSGVSFGPLVHGFPTFVAAP